MSAHRCPACTGPRIVGHPAGPLTYDHGQVCAVRDRQDSRAMADYELLGDTSVPEVDAYASGAAQRRVRSAGLDLSGLYDLREPTPAERALLAACGWTDPDRLGPVVVSTVTTGKGVVRRDFLDSNGHVIDVDHLTPPDPDPTPEETNT